MSHLVANIYNTRISWKAQLRIVDKTVVDKKGVDELVVDEKGVDEPGINL